MDRMNKNPLRGGWDNLIKVDNANAKVIPTVPPSDLHEFSTTSIFNSPEDLPDRVDPLGPYITSGEIQLTAGEKQLLSRDPKYSIVFPPDRMKLSIEIERMNAKVRYDDNSKKRKKDMNCPQRGEQKDRITNPDGDPIEWNSKKNHKNDATVQKRSDDVNYDNILGDTLGQLFTDCKDRYVYNPVTDSIDFTPRRATDYKLNKNVRLPKPMSSGKELQCERRRMTYLKAFDEYENQLTTIKTGGNKGKKKS